MLLPRMEIRPFRAGDDVAAHVAAIYDEFGLGFDSAFEDDLFDIAGVYAHGEFWVVEAAGRIVATAGVVPHGGTRLIKRIYVAADARRHGLARQLLRRCAAFGTFSRTELWSDVRFRSAHQLYLSEGFRFGHTRVLEDPDGSVERYFSR